MYEIVTHLHSILRWAVVLVGAFAVVRYAAGYFGKRPFESLDNKLGVAFMSLMDTQLLIGLVLYFFLSPSVHVAMANMAVAMKDPVLRFWAVEHLTGMLVAWVLVHIGRAVSKRALTDNGKFAKGLIWYGLSFFIMMASIPWPFRAVIGRGWF